MSTMKRWLDAESGSSGLERAVLRVGTGVKIPLGAKEQGWRRLSVATAGAAAASLVAKPAVGLAAEASGAAGAKATVASIASLGFVKGVLAGVVGCMVVQGGVSWLQSRDAGGTAPAATVVSAPAASSAARRSVVAAETAIPNNQEQAEVSAKHAGPGLLVPQPAMPRVSTQPSASPAAAAGDFALDAADSASALAKEAALLRRARSELHGGNVPAALATLELSRREVHRPQLLQEREALLIEALWRSGRRVEAEQRAREYLARFPDSPHADKVRTLLNGER